jgi:sialate O-acetylesterase
MRKFLTTALVAALVCLSGQAARADVKAHALFTDGMVLQHQEDASKGVPVWGTGDAGEDVKVELAETGKGSTAVGKVDKDGKWMVKLPTPKAGGPFTMTIKGKNELTIKDVYVGEVWICSGQSNMEWPLSATTNAKEVIENSKNPKIRLFTVVHKISAEPVTEVSGKWSECNPDTVKSFSAVGYYFGRDLAKALGKPIGLINSSWGGTVAEAWTTKAALEADDDLKGLLPKGEIDPKKPNQGTVLFNGMIAPLAPYGIKGAIWYQGESNAGRAHQYRTLFPTMIKSWRTTWKQDDFPFLFVQLAPFDPNKEKKDGTEESNWAELREAQLFTSLKLKNTAMAVITDVGEAKDIHPKMKEPVGARLALAARALAYGEKVVYQGPTFDTMAVEGNKIVLNFKHVGKGLECKGESLQGFTIAGEDKKFYLAKAELKGDQIVVTCDKVAKPIAVRYGWADCPVVNLWSKDGLPATPFRTDDFPIQSGPKK